MDAYSTNKFSSQDEIVDDRTSVLTELTPDHAAKSLKVDCAVQTLRISFTCVGSVRLVYKNT